MRVTTEDYARAERFLPFNTAPLVLNVPRDVAWMPDGTVHYSILTARGEQTVSINPGRRSRVVDGPAAKPAASDPNVVPSPDGRYLAFIRDDNLWVRESTSGAEAALTTDGVKDFGYATDSTGWKHTSHPILLWSPDSRRIATFQQDQREVGEAFILRTKPGHPELQRWKYAMAGDPVIAVIHRVIIDVPGRKVVRLQVDPDPHRSSACYDVECGDGTLADAQWSPDSSKVAFISTSRDHKIARLRLADAETGAVREVLEETAATYYESDISQTNLAAVNWRYLPASNEIIWYSARDNWAHLYLYDLHSGKLKLQITHGAWNVAQILKVDEKTRTIYFLGVGREPHRSPYFVHLYKVGMDGRHLQLLTPENGTHEVSLAPSGGYFIDSYSTPDTPQVTVLRSGDGRLPHVVGEGRHHGSRGHRLAASQSHQCESPRRRHRVAWADVQTHEFRFHAALSHCQLDLSRPHGRQCQSVDRQAAVEVRALAGRCAIAGGARLRSGRDRWYGHGYALAYVSRHLLREYG